MAGSRKRGLGGSCREEREQGGLSSGLCRQGSPMGWGGWRTEGRTQHKKGKRIRKAAGFLTVGRASRGDGGFVRQLQETVDNTETAQMGEGAGEFLLPKKDVSDCSLALP